MTDHTPQTTPTRDEAVHSPFNACSYRDECRKQASEIERLRAEVERLQQQVYREQGECAAAQGRYYGMKNRAEAAERREKAAEARAASAEAERDAKSKLADRYGVALMMIRAGCSDPARFAGNILDDREPVNVELDEEDFDENDR